MRDNNPEKKYEQGIDFMFLIWSNKIFLCV